MLPSSGSSSSQQKKSQQEKAAAQQQQQLLSLRNKKKKKPRLTNTNTDKECLRENAGFVRRILYTIDTHNGYKFFTIGERIGCHIFGWICFAIVITYSYIFCKGLIDGIQFLPSSTTASMDEMGGQQADLASANANANAAMATEEELLAPPILTE